MSRTLFFVLAVLALILSVQASSSSTGSASSSSSSTGVNSTTPALSSSSSYFPMSSTGSQGSPDAYPSNSVAVVFSVVFAETITAANIATAAPLVQTNIATNYANLTGTNVTIVEQYIVITAINGINLNPSSRRLLQASNGQNVAYVVLGNITQAIPAFSPLAAVNLFVFAAGNGTLQATSGVTVPQQSITSVSAVGSTPVSSSSSSSTGYQGNGASSIVSTPAALLFAAVASLALLL